VEARPRDEGLLAVAALLMPARRHLVEGDRRIGDGASLSRVAAEVFRNCLTSKNIAPNSSAIGPPISQRIGIRFRFHRLPLGTDAVPCQLARDRRGAIRPV
jgi:hypothetical protein